MSLDKASQGRRNGGRVSKIYFCEALSWQLELLRIKYHRSKASPRSLHLKSP